jgi:hypothetical protein
VKTETALELIDVLIQAVSIEINSIKAQVVSDIAMQVAIYAHDHLGAKRMAFGMLSDSPGLDEEHLDEAEQTKAVLLDREQRRNALKHLKHLIQVGDPEVMQILDQELSRFFRKNETYQFLFEPEGEYPNEYVKPYPYPKDH